MKKLTYAAIAIAALAFASPAQAQDDTDWMEIGTTDEGTVFYAHLPDLLAGNPSSRAARLWTKLDASADRTTSFRTSAVLNIVDCSNQSFQPISYTFRYRDHTKDMSWTEEVPIVRYAIPGTLMGDAVGILCADGGE